MEGQLLHTKADNPYVKEKRKDRFFSRAMPVSSSLLGLSGVLDVVEFTKDDMTGIAVPGKKGKWSPVIVEFKRGKQKKDLRDIVQLVAEVICLEEKFNIRISKSYLYYDQTNKKIEIDITEEMRNLVFHLSNEMHHLYEQNITTPAEISKNCKECSLVDICMPRITKKKVSIANYMSQRLDEDLT